MRDEASGLEQETNKIDNSKSNTLPTLTPDAKKEEYTPLKNKRQLKQLSEESKYSHLLSDYSFH